MFTGLIETMGTVVRIGQGGQAFELGIRPDTESFEVARGDSVAVDGACLTVERTEGGQVLFTAVAETLARTTLDRVTVGRRVNLERAMKLGDRLGGHLVLGHVDGVGEITAASMAGKSALRTIRVPPELAMFIAAKGSVAVDGISLTIAGVSGSEFTLSLIPVTIGSTTLAARRPGERVNIECDVIARYIARLMECGAAQHSGGASRLMGALERSGF